MKKRKILGWALVALLTFYVLSSPTTAAATFSSALGWARDSATAVVTFLSAITT